MQMPERHRQQRNHRPLAWQVLALVCCLTGACQEDSSASEGTAPTQLDTRAPSETDDASEEGARGDDSDAGPAANADGAGPEAPGAGSLDSGTGAQPEDGSAPDNANATPCATETGAPQGERACLVETCRQRCAVVTRCDEFVRACGEALAAEATEQCRSACDDNDEARAEVLASRDLDCALVYPLAIEGLELEDACPVGPERCGDRRDNDVDGALDCADPDCALESSCVGATAIAPQGQSLRFEGSIGEDDLLTVRLNDNCTEAVLGPDAFYESYRLINTGGERRDLQITARWQAPEAHGFLSVHDQSFDPVDQGWRSCLRAEHSFDGDPSVARVEVVTIEADQVLNVMVASHDNLDPVGDYQLEVHTGGPPELHCANQDDDDSNGLTDCLDPRCEGRPVCAETTLSIAPAGQSVTSSGALDRGDRAWRRPDEDCSPGGATDFFYETVTLRNETGEDQRVTAHVAWQGVYQDGFLHAFAPPYDLARLDGCMTGNDDSSGSIESRLTQVSIPAAESRVLVLSSHDENSVIQGYGLEVFTDLNQGQVCIAEHPLVVTDSSLQGTTGGSGLFQSQCGRDQGSAEDLYFIESPVDTPVCVRTETEFFDSMLHLRERCDDATSELVCDDDGGPGLGSQLQFEASAGTRYTLFVDGSGDEGTYKLQVSFAACQPEG